MGLDGLTDGTVEQDGILAACAGTRPVYAAWYEMFPRPPVYKHITVRPGSSIVASVFYDSRAHLSGSRWSTPRMARAST